MSEAQLKKILHENEGLKAQIERLPKMVKTSEACKELQAYVQKITEPCSPDFKEPNPWHSSSGGGFCVII